MRTGTLLRMLNECRFDRVHKFINDESVIIIDEPDEYPDYTLIRPRGLASNEDVKREIQRKGLVPATLTDIYCILAIIQLN